MHGGWFRRSGVGFIFRSQHQVRGSLILICDSVRSTFFPLLRTRLGQQFTFLLLPILSVLEYWAFISLFGIVSVELKIFIFFTVYLRQISVESKSTLRSS